VRPPRAPGSLALVLLATTFAAASPAEAADPSPSLRPPTFASPSPAPAEPPGLALRWRTIELRPDFKLYTSYQVDLTSEKHGFHVDRAYVGFFLDVLPWLGGRATLDICQATDVGRSGSATVTDGKAAIGPSSWNGSIAARLKYGYLEARWPRLGATLLFGVIHTAWIPWIEHIEGTRFLRKVLLENELRYPSADFGIAIAGHVGEWVSYIAGVYSGEGYAGIEDSSFKDIAARVSLRPAPSVRALTCLQASGHFQVEVPTSGDTRTHRWYGGALTYRLVDSAVTPDCMKVRGERLALFAQVFAGESGAPDALAPLLGLSFGGRLELPLHLFVAGRVDRFDPNLDAAADAVVRVLGAAGIHVVDGVNLALDIQASYRQDGAREQLLGVHTELSL
jgi:hypothetical protein